MWWIAFKYFAISTVTFGTVMTIAVVVSTFIQGFTGEEN